MPLEMTTLPDAETINKAICNVNNLSSYTRTNTLKTLSEVHQTDYSNTDTEFTLFEHLNPSTYLS